MRKKFTVYFNFTAYKKLFFKSFVSEVTIIRIIFFKVESVFSNSLQAEYTSYHLFS